MASIRRRGDKWQVQIRRMGQRSLSRSFRSKKDAEAWARHREVQADRHDLPTTNDPRVLERVTLGDLVKRYRDTVTPRKRGGDVERIVLNAFLRNPLCSKSLSQIGAEDFAAYRDTRLRRIKPNTLRRQLAPLRNLFEVAREEWGLPIKENPLAKVALRLSEGRRERRLRDREWERLVRAAQSRQNPFVLPMMRLALATGMRRGEILNMRWAHLDRKNRCLLIPNSKNGHARTIPLTNEALAVLDKLGEPEQASFRVFPISPNAFRLAWERVRTAAEVKDFRFHDLRHEAISRFFEAGLNVPEVALISGHRDPRLLFRYTHPLRQSIAAKLGDKR